MRLPDLVAYQAAVQHPATAFADPALKSATVVTGRLGLPRAVAGNFAVTYELRQGTQRWAVRCFHREAADRAARYAVISQTLAAARDGPLVPIDYLQNGVRVGQTWYPITRMAWIDGHPLNAAIEQHLQDTSMLEALERGFRGLVADLARRGIAHGDLQHGNILVSATPPHTGDWGRSPHSKMGGRAGPVLRLVDYDGMFVPSLLGRAASESGDPNYQHPRRSAQFGPELDRFSAIVIVLALRALRAEPGLWPTYNSGDNLLFRRTDFADPSRSALLRDLHGIPSLRELTERFVRVCEGDYSAIPGLDEFVRPAPVKKPRNSWTLHRAALQTGIAFSPDDQLIATGEREGKVHIRHRESGHKQRSLRVDGPVEALAFTPSGDLQVVACAGSVITTTTGRTFSLGNRRVRALALSSDAEWLAAIGEGGQLYCWKVTTGRIVGTSRVGQCVAVAVCGSSGRIAVADGRGEVRLLRARDLQPINSLAVGRGVTCLALAESYMATGQANGCVSVWDLRTLQPAFRPIHLATPIVSVALSHDGTRVAATGRDGTLCVRLLRAQPAPAATPREPLSFTRVFGWIRRVALL